LIPILDLGVVIVVHTCVYFDIDYYFPLQHTSLFFIDVILGLNLQQIVHYFLHHTP